MVDFRSNFTLEPLNSKHLGGLLTIVTDPKVMKHIADGKKWSKEKTMDYIRYSEEEWESYGAMDVAGRGLAWAIMSGDVVHNTVVGSVAIYPPKIKQDNYSLRIFLSQSVQGKGIGTVAAIKAIEYFRVFNANQAIDITIHQGNMPSIKSMSRVITHFYPDGVEPKEGEISGTKVWINTLPSLKCEPVKKPIDFPYHTCYVPPVPMLLENIISHYNNNVSTSIGTSVGKPADRFTWGDSKINIDSNQLALVTRKYPDQVLFSDVLTDHFVEHDRLQCIFGSKNVSPLDFFNVNRDKIPKSDNPLIYRENIRIYAKKLGKKTGQKNLGKECNLFNLYLSMTLLDPNTFLQGKLSKDMPHYWGNLGKDHDGQIVSVDGPGHILDPASGWGDRLLSSMLLNLADRSKPYRTISYTGFDTNVELQPVYAKIIKRVLDDPTNFVVHKEPFEESGDIIGTEEKYNTIITSPPFYTVEIYKGDQTSTTKYGTKDKIAEKEVWLEKYYKPMWLKCTSVLKSGGRIIAYIAPWMFKDTHDAIMSDKDMVYLGHVDFVQFTDEDQISDPRNHRPAFIWRKKIEPPLPPLTHSPLGSPPHSPYSPHSPPHSPPPGPPPGAAPQPDQYYVGSGERLEFQRFNNFIKRELIGRYRGYHGDSSLLDLASGKGGDIDKWCSVKYNKVVGIELDPVGVKNANDRVQKIKSNTTKPCDTEMLFIAGDTSKPIFPNQEAGHDAENKKLMSTIQKNSFDIVSMQFAVHYMFKDIQKLQRFINNVGDTIQPGGYFIGTCFDGKKVLDKLNRNGGSIKSVGSDGQDTNVWSIRMVKKGSGYGALGKVGVFVKSIGKEHEEYLVDFDSFTDIMKENGFTLHDKRDFDDYYDSYISQGGEEVPEDQREFSFLNTTFVYRKEGGWYSFGKTKKRTEPCTCCSDFKYI